jgi:hypothetical protein
MSVPRAVIRRAGRVDLLVSKPETGAVDGFLLMNQFAAWVSK